MTMIKGLSWNDSGLIGFVTSSLCYGIITMDEMRQWVYSMIDKHDDLPPYMYHLMDAQSLNEAEKIIGFNTGAHLNNSEINALMAIYTVRFPNEEWDANIYRGTAINALKRNPHVIEQFKDIFPFITLPDTIDEFRKT